MKSIQVYDPPMACSSSACGTEADPDVVNFSKMLSQLYTCGIQVQRFNLGLHPLSFAQNAAVRALLITGGTDVLPVIFWDDQVRLKGRYPTSAERASWLHAAFTHECEDA